MTFDGKCVGQLAKFLSQSDRATRCRQPFSFGSRYRKKFLMQIR
jgi:hypothetical protein